MTFEGGEKRLVLAASVTMILFVVACVVVYLVKVRPILDKVQPTLDKLAPTLATIEKTSAATNGFITGSVDPLLNAVGITV